MRFVVGDDTGLVKEVLGAEQKLGRKMGSQALGEAVTHLVWACAPGEETRFAVVRSCGRIELVDNTNGDGWKILKTWQTSDDVKAAHWEDGKLSFVSGDGTWLTVADDGSDEESDATSQSSWNSAVKASVCAVRPGSDHSEVMVVSAEGANPRLMDREGKTLWRGRNVQDSKYDLKVEFDVTAIEWLSSECAVMADSQGKVRAYAVKEGGGSRRRPLLELPLTFVTEISSHATGQSITKGRPVTRMYHDEAAKLLYIGDTVGTLMALSTKKILDLVSKEEIETPEGAGKAGRIAHLKYAKSMLPFVRGFSGIMGSIRGIVTLGDLIFVCGLGRFAYVYRGKQQVCKVYLKQKLTAILPLSCADDAAEDDDESENGDEASDLSDGEPVAEDDEEEDGLGDLDESDGSSEGDFGDFDEEEEEEEPRGHEGKKRKQEASEGPNKHRKR
ncbi:hypothetical protein FOZ61_010724 [Perkinsus olseni]|uniref:Uncharacterized protein n=1 Tax=Perkinsus olseni TaxID=32597 RepID=A0A7J6ML58_PEROL|nr:hypothetical protein FOZ61_010724 [Perkinsus olseni]KAF4672107.1 hypothetical protein FOL46_009479 [Perkinsus olseni]